MCARRLFRVRIMWEHVNNILHPTFYNMYVQDRVCYNTIAYSSEAKQEGSFVCLFTFVYTYKPFLELWK